MIRIIQFYVLIVILFSSCSALENKNTSDKVEITNELASGVIKHVKNFKSVYVPMRNIDIWIPNNYTSKIKYSVLYMHDGQMLFDSTTTWNKQEWKVDETMTMLMKRPEIRKCIVVGISNAGEYRHAEYFPQKVYEALPKLFRDSVSANSPEGSIPLGDSLRSDRYLKFLVEELKPYIDANYSTLPDMANTYIGGSSMGGLISLYAICEYPKVFGGALCMSTHWPGVSNVNNQIIPQAFVNYLSSSLPDPFVHNIYFDYGTKTLDSLYEPLQISVDEVMRKRGYTSENWTTSKFTGADHSERSWSDRFSIPVRFLLEMP